MDTEEENSGTPKRKKIELEGEMVKVVEAESRKKKEKFKGPTFEI